MLKIEESGKMVVLVNLLKSLEGQKVVVVSHYTQVFKKMNQYLHGKLLNENQVLISLIILLADIRPVGSNV